MRVESQMSLAIVHFVVSSTITKLFGDARWSCAGSHSCYTIRLDGELMGLPLQRGLFLHLPAYCVWKRCPFSQHVCWLWRISIDKVAQSHCWVCWGSSTPGPVVCHQKSLLKIYGYYLCLRVCIQIRSKCWYTSVVWRWWWILWMMLAHHGGLIWGS